MRFAQAVSGLSSVALAVLLCMVRADVFGAPWLSGMVVLAAVVVGGCGAWLAIDVAAWWLSGCPSVAEIQRRKVDRAYEQGCEDMLEKWADDIQAQAELEREAAQVTA